MKKATFSLIAALIISALKNIRVPDVYNVKFGIPEHEQTLNNFIYFFGVDLMLFLLMLTIGYLCIKETVLKTIATAARYLAFGKIIDEFVSPYGYGIFEMIYDIIVTICTVIALMRLPKPIR